MKEARLKAAVKLELYSLIQVIVPYWLHLWAGLQLQRLVHRALLKCRSETLGEDCPVLLWIFFHVPKSWCHGLVSAKQGENWSQRDTVPAATAVSDIS